jgi:hypothetical protein
MSAVSAETPLPALVKAQLAGEVLATYVLARRALRSHDLPGALAVLRAPRSERNAPLVAGQTLLERRRLARVVIRTLGPLPADTRCLMRSLVLTRMLARRGIACQLVIAVRPGERFAAHSWLERDGETLLPPGTSGFARLVTL